MVVRPRFVGPKGFVAFLPVLSFPACSGFAGSCGFSSPIWFTPFAMGSPLWGRDLFVLDRNEGFVCFPFPFVLFLHVGPALGVLVTIWVCVLVGSCFCATAGTPRCMLEGLEPLSETPLSTLSLRGCFWVVLAEDESLRLSFALSGVLPCPVLWLPACLHGTCSGPKVVLGAIP